MTSQVKGTAVDRPFAMWWRGSREGGAAGMIRTLSGSEPVLLVLELQSVSFPSPSLGGTGWLEWLEWIFSSLRAVRLWLNLSRLIVSPEGRPC